MSIKKSIVHIERQVVGDFCAVPSVSQMETWGSATINGHYNQASIGIRIVDINEGAHLNSRWRGKTGPTNVLAFTADVPEEFCFPILLGELVICAPVLEKEAREQGKTVLAHWAHMVVHGTLHLLGYDHVQEQDAEEMECLEKKVLSELGFRDPYG